MRRCKTILVLTALLLAVPDRAFAHGFGIRYDIPVPFWLYAYGAAAAVVLTFVLLVDTKPAPHLYPRFDLLRVGWFRAVFAGRPFLLGVRTFAAPVVGVLGISGLGSLYLIQTLGLISVPLLFLTAYFGFVKLAQIISGGATSTWRFAAAYAYTLVPIALAYEAAHYYTLFIIQGQAIVALISDPFGWGWNLFGTAGYDVNVGVVRADFVWYSQVALIVVGHVIAVYLAHGIALRLLQDRRQAVRSQYPMLALMVLYTVLSLWILNQPIVEATKIASVVVNII